MKYRALGKTGLQVSVMGIGSGGPSRLGQLTSVSEGEVKRMVHYALEKGVNFIDTAAVYSESEAILGRILQGISKDSYILATKFKATNGRDQLVTPREVVKSVERSLERLRVESIDLLQFHAVDPNLYIPVRDRLMPTLLKLREAGKFRFLGLTETYSRDPLHETLSLALEDDLFDTVMVGYNLLSPAPEHDILPRCLKKNIGVICMVAVRRGLSRPEYLRKTLAEAKSRGLIPAGALPEDDPLGWLVKGPVQSIPAAGYKYVAAHSAISTVLSGTSNIDHFKENLEAILGPPLPEEDVARLRSVFGEVREPLGN